MAASLFVAPPTSVDAPALQRHRFGLFSVANMIDRPEPRFQNGVEFEPVSCGPIAGVSGICFEPGVDPDPEGWPLDVRGVSQPSQPLVTGLPFAVYGWYDCSAFSRPVSEAEARAREHLYAGEEREVERAIAVGDYDNEPSFVGATDLSPGGEVPLSVGFGLLEGFLGTEYGGVGAIHMPRSVVSLAHDLVSRQGQRLETKLGNYVVASAGLDQALQGLHGADVDGPVTLYATSIPTVRRSEVWVNPDPEFRPQTANNNLTVYAWRVYLVTWECVTATVQVEVPIARV